MNAYRRDFDKTKYMSFLIKHDELLEKYIEICEKVENSIKIEFDSEPVYNEKYLKAKVKSYGKINTNFHNNKIPKEDSQRICLLVILIDSVFRTGNKYYSQVLLSLGVVFLYIKMTNNDYQKDKEKLQKEACEIYQNLSEEEKEKRKKASVSL